MSNFKIYYSDKNIAVCEKPVGVSSQDDGQICMPNLIRQALGCQYIGVIHRLDTAVGGIMVYALNKESAAFLSSQVTDGTFKKHYLALIHGKPENDSGVFEDLLFKDSRKNKSFVVKKERKGVKKASLEYNVLSTKQTESGDLSIVEILLHTGRTHQIRVQFASRKMALVGDGKYGACDNVKQIGLLCKKLEFYVNKKASSPAVFESDSFIEF